MLKVEKLNVHYGVIHALKDVSMEVKEGEIVSLIGANGAGKTTLLQTISGLLKKTSGEVVFLGQGQCQEYRKGRYHTGTGGTAYLLRYECI